MLKGIDPLLTPELLKLLAEMGHGDEIVVADANFTATTLAGGKPVVHVPGAGVAEVAAAVLSLLPLAEDVDHPVGYMHVSGQPDGYRSALQRDVVQRLVQAGHARPAQCAAVERFAFYDRTRRAHAIVLTGELQPFANFVFTKGVLGEALVP